MAELTESRENDARVAVAMGWRLQRETIRGFGGELIWGNHVWDPDGEDQGWWHEKDDWVPVPAFLTDPALVVPMLERIYELTGTMARLDRSREGWTAVAWRELSDEGAMLWQAPTANLALGATLLAVAEAVKGDG